MSSNTGFVAACQSRVVGQDKHCKRCSYVWDLKDPDPPKCKTEHVVREDRIAQLRGLFKCCTT